EKGTHIHYTLEIGHGPVNEDYHLSLWLKSTRPGVQVLARLVLPRERDPANLGQPLSVLVKCEPYGSTRWKLIILREPVRRLRDQQQLLQHKLGRPVNTDGAYVDRLVLNAYDGPGLTDVWIDDVEVGPVLESRPPALPSATPTGKAGAAPGPQQAGPRQSAE